MAFTKEELDRVKAVEKALDPPEFDFYDLQAPVQTMYPILTPFVNARIKSQGIQAHWRATNGIHSRTTKKDR
jgi:hypothetical protein